MELGSEGDELESIRSPAGEKCVGVGKQDPQVRVVRIEFR